MRWVGLKLFVIIGDERCRNSRRATTWYSRTGGFGNETDVTLGRLTSDIRVGDGSTNVEAKS
jgi:hypothetical protein